MKNLKSFIIGIYKVSVSITLGSIFFLVFMTKNSALHVISRTLLVTIFIFTISYILFCNIYGYFSIGVEKSKQVSINSSIALFFTDILAYLALTVMNTNPNNEYANPTIKFEYIYFLLIVFVIQSILSYIFARLGNWIFFSLFEPKEVIIIGDDNERIKSVQDYLGRYDKEFTIKSLINITKGFDYSSFSKFEHVFICGVKPEVLKLIISECYINNISYSYIPEPMNVMDMGGYIDIFDDIPMITVNSTKLNYTQRFLKRCIDLVFSTLLIFLTIPIWIMISLSIKLEDGGPIFFKQDRMTIDRKIFSVYKFRSMKVNSKNYSAVENDDRITKVGKIIRKLRIDELPQILNIFVGDMSVVGPRPEMLSNIYEYEEQYPEFSYRLSVKAGLTGIAQIEGKYNSTPEDKLLLDLIYIENYSVWLDIKYIFRTVIIFFKNDSTEGF